MSVIGKDGSTLREHLVRAAENGKRDDRLDNEMPPFAESVWVAFNRCSRPGSMGGISKISQQEYMAYQFNYGIKFNDWEMELLSMLDSIAIEIFSKDKPA